MLLDIFLTIGLPFAAGLLIRNRFERFAVRELVGKSIPAGNVMFETDFPHPTCLHGSQVQEAVESRLKNVDQATRDAILWRNAAELYGVKV